jgi:fibronectin type 3 domain-containing protein
VQGQVVSNAYQVTVSDGVLDVLLDDLGGANPFLAIQGLEIDLYVPSGPSVTNVVVDDVSQNEGSGGGTTTFTFTVSLEDAYGASTTLGQDVTVTLDTSDVSAVAPGDYTALAGQLVTITAGTTSTTFDVLVGADDDAESDETFEVNLSNALLGGSADPTLVILDGTGIATIEDDDTPLPAFSPLFLDFGTDASPVASGYTQVTSSDAWDGTWGWQAGAVGLGDTERSIGDDLERDFTYLEVGTFSVAVPNGTYEVTVILGDTQGSSSGKDQMGVFLEGAQVDTVSTVQGQVVSNAYQVTVSDGVLDVLLDDLGGANPFLAIQGLEVGLAPPAVLLTQTDSDTSVTEGGNTDTYDIALSDMPTGDVEVTVTADAETEVSLDGTNFSSSVALTFTNANGTTPQTVTVRAVDDADGEGSHSSTISHAITSSADTVNYPTSLGIADLTVTVIDDDIFNVIFVVNYTDGASEGFNDPTLGQTRRAALEYALDILEGQLSASYAGETITVDAAMDPMGGGVLGGASPLSIWDVSGYATGAALANHLVGYDLDTNDAEIGIALNSSFADWYYGTDGNTPGSSWDFVTTVVHEVGHGLNFYDGLSTNGSFYYGVPGIFDKFLERGNGTDVVGEMDNSQRASAIVSDDLYWNGTNATTANSGSRVKMYAPNPVELGSSISHVDQDTYGNTAVMSPALYNGVAKHLFADFEMGMMKDMGWHSIADGGNPVPVAGGGTQLASTVETSSQVFSVAVSAGDRRVEQEAKLSFQVDEKLPGRASDAQGQGLIKAKDVRQSVKTSDADAQPAFRAEPPVQTAMFRSVALATPMTSLASIAGPDEARLAALELAEANTFRVLDAGVLEARESGFSFATVSLMPSHNGFVGQDTAGLVHLAAEAAGFSLLHGDAADLEQPDSVRIGEPAGELVNTQEATVPLLALPSFPVVELTDATERVLVDRESRDVNLSALLAFGILVDLGGRSSFLGREGNGDEANENNSRAFL